MTPTQGAPPANTAKAHAGSADLGPPPSAATVRKAIIQVLADSGPSTAKAIEEKVGKLLPAAEKPSVRQQLQTLSEGEYVVDAPDEPRSVTLSESGLRWWNGIEALSPRTA
jgi:hypothetical protein